MSERLSASPAAAHRGLTELHEAGILGRSKDQKGRTICWTADRHLALVALTERSNRVGGEDTRNRKPKLGPAAPRGREVHGLVAEVEVSDLRVMEALAAGAVLAHRVRSP